MVQSRDNKREGDSETTMKKNCHGYKWKSSLKNVQRLLSSDLTECWFSTEMFYPCEDLNLPTDNHTTWRYFFYTGTEWT